MESTQILHRALDQTHRIVTSITPDQLSRSTPCTDFDVKALLNHTVASVQGLANAARGETWDMSGLGDLLDRFGVAGRSPRSCGTSGRDFAFG